VLKNLKATPYFRTYKVNLERECPFWAQQRLCGNNKCAVCECSDSEIPLFWKEQKSHDHQVVHDDEKIHSAANIGLLTDTFFFGKAKPDLTCPQNDKEWCIEEKESEYRLNEADYIIVNLMENIESFTAYEGAPIWKAIYEENCILSPLDDHDKDQCTESTLLLHLMSGLHTSINTHVSANFFA
jgi:hypothetical protein